MAGPLAVFIARKVCRSQRLRDHCLNANYNKNIPSDIKWEPNTVPPQYTDHADQVIEKGTTLRLKILGVKPDVAAINAIGTIKEDYLGWVFPRAWAHTNANPRYPLQTTIVRSILRITTITTIQNKSDGRNRREILYYTHKYQTYRAAGVVLVPGTARQYIAAGTISFLPARDRMKEPRLIGSSPSPAAITISDSCISSLIDLVLVGVECRSIHGHPTGMRSRAMPTSNDYLEGNIRIYNWRSV